MSYYNTTNLEGDQLKESVKSARSQKEAIFRIYRSLGRAIGPTEMRKLYVKYKGKDISINSVRRSITDLTSEGRLRKTQRQTVGDWGKKEYLWKIN